jgi:hypothetical protein
MGYKKGQQIRMTERRVGLDLGEVFTLTEDGERAVFFDSEGDRRSRATGFELVTPKWVPKVGDRVIEDKTAGCASDLVEHWNSYWRRREGELINNEFVVTKITDNYTYYSNRPGGGGPMIEFKFIKPAALTVEAGKFYKTHDGRKVGPMLKISDGVFSGKGAVITSTGGTKTMSPQKYIESGAVYMQRNGEEDDALIAEWIDEPAVATAKPKFKVGDIVKFRDDYSSSARGKKAVVINVSTWGIQVDLGGHDGVSTESPDSLVLFSTILPKRHPTAIVALIENGVPKPSERPFVHPTESAAATEATRLARKHKGQQFGVYVLTTTSQEAAPTYEHEWQTLAAKGEKISSIKALREQASIDLYSAKRAVEAFVDKIAA